MKLAAVLPAALLAAPGVSAAVMYPMAFSDPTTPALKERSACVGPLLAYLKANETVIAYLTESVEIDMGISGLPKEALDRTLLHMTKTDKGGEPSIVTKAICRQCVQAKYPESDYCA